MDTMDLFFKPQSVAVIGASHDPKKVGHVVFRNFFDGHFPGKVYPINPNIPSIFDQRCYASVLDVPGKVDLAIITIPGVMVPKALEECGKKGIRAAIIISAGFGEIGNFDLEKQMIASAKKAGIRFIGPNCLGVYCPSTGMDTLFLPRFKLGRPEAGTVSYISQSGATGSVVLDWMAMKGYKIAKFVSYGNATNIDEADLLTYLAKDPDTKVICVYCEGVKQGRKFFDIAKKLQKPIIVLKGGQTDLGAKATLSHTGSLAGESKVYDAAFVQAGITKAETLEQVFDFARVFSTQPKPKGKRVQIITDGGGYGVLTTDALVRNGLELAQINPKRIEEMRTHMPSHVVLKNPMDITGDADTERYRLAIAASLEDPGVDMLAVIALFQVPTLGGDVVEVIAEARGKKPMIVIAGGGKYTETLKKPLEDVGVPTFSYPEQAMAALRALCEYSARKK